MFVSFQAFTVPVIEQNVMIRRCTRLVTTITEQTGREMEGLPNFTLRNGRRCRIFSFVFRFSMARGYTMYLLCFYTAQKRRVVVACRFSVIAYVLLTNEFGRLKL